MKMALRIDKKKLASMVDHTLLKPFATQAMITDLCVEALTHGFGAVCVNACWADYVVSRLDGTDVKTCVVIGFPLGAMDSEAKAYEAKMAIKSGVDEVDMVLNVGWLKGGQFQKVQYDIAGVVSAAEGRVVKVILETCYLTPEEIATACELVVKAGASFVKTSTGFGTPTDGRPNGATVEHVALMHQIVGSDCGVKASGGVKDYGTAMLMIEAAGGWEYVNRDNFRIGTSSGLQILTGIPTE